MINNTTYIHLGLHKTGSTFFQKTFYPGFNEFNYLPLRDMTVLGEFNQYILREHPLTYDVGIARELFFKNLSEEFLADKSITLCEEQLSGLPLQNASNRRLIFDRLHAFFPNAKYILVLRNQRDFIASMYAEYLKKGGMASLNDFLAQKNTQLNFSRGTYLNYYAYYHYIKELVGEARIKVLYYEKLKTNRSSFLEELQDYFGFKISVSEDILDSKNNVSIKQEKLESLRFYNRIGKTAYHKEHLIPRRFKKSVMAIHNFISSNKTIDKHAVTHYLKTLDLNNEKLPDYINIKDYGY
ncbi:sulfotransferase domain-containing protein [uncultured Winogradskyella sp.]|uniref:sulfotransferase domain-containing protein n=1 Tax=uncultured Winogradskyella sp. TaxID=395353 RepID=UPI002607E13B|nr:sulfotransferase domain-containing protein [uncultured Winogradskyella sp.]